MGMGMGIDIGIAVTVPSPSHRTQSRFPHDQLQRPHHTSKVKQDGIMEIEMRLEVLENERNGVSSRECASHMYCNSANKLNE